MAKGLGMPVGVNAAGGALMVESDEDLLKVIMLALSGGESGNAFQRLGIDETLVFGVNNAKSVAMAQIAITDVFQKLSALGMAMLAPDGIQLLNEGKAEGEMTIHVSYINLETNLPDEFNVSFVSGSTARIERV